MRRRGLLLVMIGALGIGACQRDPATREAAATASGTGAAAAAAPAPAARPRVVALGDSLTAGLGLAPDVAWPALVQQKIAAGGLDAEVVNAGVSGDTTAGGLRRLDWALDGDVKVLVLELGANDGLARPAGRSDAGQPLADDHDGQGSRHHRAPVRHGSAAELRAAVHARLPRGIRDAGRRARRRASSRSCSTASPATPR